MAIIKRLVRLGLSMTDTAETEDALLEPKSAGKEITVKELYST